MKNKGQVLELAGCPLQMKDQWKTGTELEMVTEAETRVVEEILVHISPRLSDGQPGSVRLIPLMMYQNLNHAPIPV